MLISSRGSSSSNKTNNASCNGKKAQKQSPTSVVVLVAVIHVLCKSSLPPAPSPSPRESPHIDFSSSPHKYRNMLSLNGDTNITINTMNLFMTNVSSSMASEESSSSSGGGATAAEAVPPDADNKDAGAGQGVEGGEEKEVLAETAQSEKLRLTAEKLKLQVGGRRSRV